MGNARHCGVHLFVECVLGVQGTQNVHRALQCIHTRVGYGSVGHFSMHRHFHLQAAVVGSNDLVGKTSRYHPVGFGEVVLE